MALKNKCKHDGIISCSRRTNGWESWIFSVGELKPWEFADDFNVIRAKPKTGLCDQCKRRVRVPYELSGEK